MNFYTKTSLLAAIILLISQIILAQNSPIWSEDFSENTSSALPAGWSSADISENTYSDGVPRDILWERCSNQLSCPPATLDFEIATDFRSTSANNGYVYCYSKQTGELDQIEDVPHLSQITSPIQNIPTDAEELFLEFQSFMMTNFIREFTGARLYIQADGGNWDLQAIYPNVPNNEPQILQRTHNANVFLTDISEYLGSETLRFRWEWEGLNEEVWCLDDIKLFTSNPQDIRKIWGDSSFSGGLNDWTVSPQTIDTCNWYWSAYGSYGNALLPFGNDNKFINSPTARNGAMIVNGDHCFTQGTTAPSDPYPFIAELISPTIDLSETTEEVVLDFYQVIRKFDEPLPGFNSINSYAFSTDNGQSWSPNIPLNQNYPQNLTLHTHETHLLPEEVVGKSAVKIKFIFAGTFFYWAIDDVRILRRARHDLRISENFYAVAPNYAVPSSQIDSISFLADIENFGTDIKTDIRLNIEIKNKFTQEVVHVDSLFIDEVQPLNLAENNQFPKSFLPSAEPAEYIGEYRVSNIEIDQVPQNNSQFFEFKVTEDLFAKERLSSIGFSPASRAYAWGNCFYVPNGNGYRAKRVEFKIENIEDMAGEIVQIHLYEWLENDIDTLIVSPDEYQLLSSEFHSVEGIEEGFISKTLTDLNTGEPVLLQDDTQYMLVFKYTNDQSNAPRCFLSTSQEIDYNAMFFSSYLRQDLRYATVVDDNLDGVYDIIGLGNTGGFNFIPQIRMIIADTATQVARPILEDDNYSIFPNPSIEDIELISEKKIEGNLQIYSSEGKKISSINAYTNGQKISVSQLNSGVYYLHYLPDNETFTVIKKFLVSH